jgi:hypothetical protein
MNLIDVMYALMEGREREKKKEEREKNGCLTQSRSTLWHCCCNLING